MIVLRAATGTGTLIMEALLNCLPIWGTSEYLYRRKKPLCLNFSFPCLPIFLALKSETPKASPCLTETRYTQQIVDNVF